MKISISTAAALLLLITNPTFAADPHANEPHRNAKAGYVFGNALAGVAIAGPIGGAIGAAIGAWTSGKVIDGYDKEFAEEQLANERASNQMLQEQFAVVVQEKAELQNLAADSLEFQVLFHTGDSALADLSRDRIERLAAFLVNQDSLEIRLSGFTDPRGTDSFNDLLARARVDAIADVLAANGVAPERISTQAFGKTLSIAANGNFDAYALERRVSIELVPVADDANLAASF
jgi:outer membrane protein OmpA-like peptidoglycan-associated protein